MNNFLNIQNKIGLYAKVILVILGLILPITTTGVDILIYIAALLCIVSGQWSFKFEILKRNYVVISVLLFFSLYLIGSIYSVAPFKDSFVEIHKYSKLLLIPLLLPLFYEKEWRNAALNAFLISIGFILVLSCLKFFHILNIGKSYDTVFQNHISMGYILAFAAFIFGHKFLNTKSKSKWLYCTLALLASFAVFFFNAGRTGYVVYAVLLVVFLWQTLNRKGIIIALLSIPILAGALFLSSKNFQVEVLLVKQNISQYIHKTDQNTSIGDRLSFIQNSTHLIKQNPLIGTGTGSFSKTFYSLPTVPAGFDKGLDHPHNEFLMTSIQFGIIGLLIIFLMFYTQFLESFKLEDSEKKLAQGLIFATIIAAFCDTVFRTTTIGHYYVFFTALLYGGLIQKSKKTEFTEFPAKLPISVIIITKNSAHTIKACLESIKWSTEIIIIDSGSTDETLNICKQYTNRIFTNPWPGFGPQKNFALSHATQNWVLSIDADEQVSPTLAKEIVNAIKTADYEAYNIPFQSNYCGKPIRYGTWFNEKHIRLFKRSKAKFSNDLVHENIIVQGNIGLLGNQIIHNTYQNLSEVIEKINRYSTAGALLRLNKNKHTSFINALWHGFWAFMKSYLFLAGFMDGKEGLMLAISNAQTSYYTYLKLLYLQNAKANE